MFTPTGDLNDRPKAEALVARLAPQLRGPEWAKTRRLLNRPESFTFLDRLHRQLQELPLDETLRRLVLDVEGLRRCSQHWHQPGPTGAVARGLSVVVSVQWAKTPGEQREQASALVRRLLRSCWRASSLVECINSVLRMQQARHRRLTQGLLDLKRLYWNCRVFRTGRRRGQTPYGMLGLNLPTPSWWQLLKLSPQELQQLLSAPKLAA